VAGIALQQALAFQVTANALRDGVRQLGEFIAGGRLDPAKPCTGPVGAVDVNTVQPCSELTVTKTTAGLYEPSAAPRSW
jgi:hypothetical protein